MEREKGYLICRGKQGLVRGKTVTGQKHSVNIPMKCPAGTRPVGLVHSHPSGNPSLSSQDRLTGREFKIAHICTVTTSHGVKCYRTDRG